MLQISVTLPMQSLLGMYETCELHYFIHKLASKTHQTATARRMCADTSALGASGCDTYFASHVISSKYSRKHRK